MEVLHIRGRVGAHHWEDHPVDEAVEFADDRFGFQ